MARAHQEQLTPTSLKPTAQDADTADGQRQQQRGVEKKPELAVSQPRRLISLREACLRRGISVGSYWRDTSLLPVPIRGKGKHLFLDQEVDALIDQLLLARTT